MFKSNFLYAIFIVNFLLTKQKQCGHYEVANCDICDTQK